MAGADIGTSLVASNPGTAATTGMAMAIVRSHAAEKAKSHPTRQPPVTPPPAASMKSEPGRRPRGRPAGSKNKPKPPVIIARESAGSLRAHALEVGAGCDVVECLARFARRRQRGVYILGGTGCVMNISLRQAGGGIVTLHGRFDIVSLLGSFFPSLSPAAVTGLTVLVSGPQGQVAGGVVVEPLIAASPVVVMAATFMSATFDRLPLDEEDGAMHGNSDHRQLHRNHARHPQRIAAPPSMFGVYQGMVPGAGLSPETYAWVSGRPLEKS